MNTELILYRNEEQIAKDLEQERRFIPFFQPFVNALLQNEFKTKPTIYEIRTCILLRSLDDFLKREALLLEDEINSMKISIAKKMELIEPTEIFNNYNQLKRLYDDLPQQEFNRVQINNYILDAKGQLILPKETIDEITERHTAYASSEKQKRIFVKANNLLNEMKAMCKETGFNFFHPHLPGVHNVFDLTSDKWMIHHYNFKKQLEERNNS